MLKILKYSFIIIFLTSCGYTPIYSNLKNNNINIQVQNTSGDKDLNNLIVVETRDAILVSDKKSSQKLKNIVHYYLERK